MMKRLILATLLGSTALLPAVGHAQTSGAQPGAGTQATQSGQVRPVAVSQIKGKDVYTQRGQQMGEVERVILGQGDQVFGVIKFGEFLGLGGESRIVPLSRMALQDDRIIVQGLSDADVRTLPAYRDNMAGYREAEPAYQARLQVVAAGQPQNQAQQNQAQQNQGSDQARIVLQQTAPTVRVDPADPRVTVRQPQPQVTVNQAQPEIIVRQPQPTVRVDIPQPEIIVRMPEPDVNVAMAQPQVQVNQPRPEVQVVQPQQQPQVQMGQSQPQVMVQRQAGAEPNVQVQRAEGQPQVRYERAEPRVIVNQAQGQPNVRIERAQDAQQQAQANQQQQQRTARAQMTDQEPTTQARTGTVDPLETARRRLGINDVDWTAAVALAPTATRPLTISQLREMDVYNLRGEELGEIDRVVVDPATNQRYAIVEHGGFLGLGEDQVALPLNRFWLRGDRLVIRGVTEDELDAMPEWQRRSANYRELGDNFRTDVSIWE